MSEDTLDVVRRHNGRVRLGCRTCFVASNLNPTEAVGPHWQGLLPTSWAVVGPSRAETIATLDQVLAHDTPGALAPLVAGVNPLLGWATGGAAATTAATLLYLWLWHREKLTVAIGDARAAGRATHARVTRAQMAREVERTLQSGTATYADEIETGLIAPVPRNVRVRWTDGGDDYVEPHEGGAIIVMRRADRRGRNIAKALLVLLEGVLIAEVRDYVHEHVRTATELEVADEILRGESAQRARHELGELSQDARRANPEFALAIQKIERVARYGLLTRVVLPEFVRTASGYSAAAGAPGEYVDDTANFIAWLYLLADWNPADGRLPSYYDGYSLHVSIVRTGWKAADEDHGAWTYEAAIAFDRNRGADAAYLLAFDDAITGAQEVYKALTGEEKSPAPYTIRSDYAQPAYLRHNYALLARVWTRMMPMPSWERRDNAFRGLAGHNRVCENKRRTPRLTARSRVNSIAARR